MVDDVVWVWVLNPTLEPKKVYKNARIAFAENIESFLLYNKITLTIMENKGMNLILKKNVNSSSMSLSCEEMTKVRSLCAKYEVIYSRNSNDMGFCDRIYRKIKLKKGCCAIQTYIRMHEVWGKKSHEKNCWRLGTRQLSRTNTFRLGSTIIPCIKKGWNLSLDCRLPWSEKTNKKIMLAFTTK